jgi:hypothetical protein
MPSESAWVGLAGALGGVSLTGLVGLGSAALTHKWTQGARLQERRAALDDANSQLRRGVYSRFLTACLAVVASVETSLEDDKLMANFASFPVNRKFGVLRGRDAEAFGEYEAAKHAAQLVASQSVRIAIDTYEHWLGKEMAERAIEVGNDPAGGDVVLSDGDANSALLDAMRDDLLDDALL